MFSRRNFSKSIVGAGLGFLLPSFLRENKSIAKSSDITYYKSSLSHEYYGDENGLYYNYAIIYKGYNLKNFVNEASKQEGFFDISIDKHGDLKTFEYTILYRVYTKDIEIIKHLDNIEIGYPIIETFAELSTLIPLPELDSNGKLKRDKHGDLDYDRWEIAGSAGYTEMRLRYIEDKEWQEDEFIEMRLYENNKDKSHTEVIAKHRISGKIYYVNSKAEYYPNWPDDTMSIVKFDPDKFNGVNLEEKVLANS